ncbi:NAD(P)-binding protein [Roridomyces roridus]|uniref:NAD(P)-binding protein n=1 Tax=Roridomyces roridus TaxID=1738132 RepID=A0AAD7BP71_9AGAR|nr:NAD(P)-binding protein [Roridomyces roridus]
MAASRIVSVFGATGNQGASVVEALLADGTFTPRAITRNPDSQQSRTLKARGVDVVKGDTTDKASLVAALRGSEAVFAVTLSIFVPNADGPDEITQGKYIVDAAKEVGAKFVVFSSVPNVTNLSDGKYTKVTAYDYKSEIEEYLRTSGLANASLHLGSFTENLYRPMMPLLKKTPAGKLDMSHPLYDTASLQAWTWVGRDVGQAALALFKNYDDPDKKVSGKVYPVVTANMTYPELAALVGKVLGQEVTYTSTPATGMAGYDEMIMAQSEYNGFFASSQVPDPELIAMGAKFGTMEEFVETELKKRFA